MKPGTVFEWAGVLWTVTGQLQEKHTRLCVNDTGHVRRFHNDVIRMGVR